MVSLRRKKYKKSFVGEKRRSARLLALDVVRSSKPSYQMQWETNIIEDAYHTQEIGETSICSRNGTVSKIIQHVLDVLELKDSHELFTMPDSMQIDDYTERVKSPSDFATLRQKNIDGMYTNLEQFESDVYAVFEKAITINDHNTIPYKQAIFLQDEAKQVLQSLTEKLGAWQQNHVMSGRKKLRQNASESSDTALLSEKLNNRICSKRKLEIFPSREEESDAVEPRLTYMADKDSQFGIISSTFGNQKPYLVLNTATPAYLESMRSFTKNGGPEAQKAAEACSRKARIDPVFRQPQFDSTTLAQFFPQQIYNRNCKLETDELLTCFRSIGTPDFIQKLSHATLRR